MSVFRQYDGFEQFVGLVSSGMSISDAALQVGVHRATGFRWARRAGLTKPVKLWLPRTDPDRVEQRNDCCDDGLMQTHICGRYLSFWERDQISIGLCQGESIRSIAARLGRPASTVGREISRNKTVNGYLAAYAQHLAKARAKRPKVAKLVADSPLRTFVVDKLKQKYSPDQISNRIKMQYPTDVFMRVSAETIYQSIYVQARGGLKTEIEHVLRSGRTYRVRKGRKPQKQPKMANMVAISQRPPEIEDRAVPGHWEGDLIMGSGNRSAILTLVERTTRYVMLAHLDGDHKAETVAKALIKLIQTLPAELQKSIT